jgi:hypothetical protein
VNPQAVNPQAGRTAALRILVGGYATAYLIVRAPHFWDVAALERRAWEPVGVAGWLDTPPPAAAVRALLVATVVAGVAFVAGARHRVTGPSFAALFLALTTLRNSWGQVWHTENLVVWHLAILAFAPAADVWSLDARRAPRAARPTWAPQLMSAVTVATYAVAGITKLRESGVDWARGDVLRNQVAYDNVRKAALGADYSTVAGVVLEHRVLWLPIACATLAVELGAPLALAGRRAAWCWAAAAWCFHAGVLAIMAISFPYPLSGIAFASMLPVERAVARGARRRRAASLARARAGRRDWDP